MKRKTIILLCLAFLILFQPGSSTADGLNKRIYGGWFYDLSNTPVAFISTFWFTGYAWCTGTLVADDLILTAAHCVVSASGDILLDALATVGGNTYQVDAIASHSSYNPFLPPFVANMRFDLALIKLSNKVTNVLPLPVFYDLPLLAGAPATIAGFGANDEGISSHPFHPYETGKQGVVRISGFSTGMIRSNVLGNSSNPTNPCQGDSGGPLIYTIRSGDSILFNGLIGAVSFGPTEVIGNQCVISNWLTDNHYVDLRSESSQAFLRSLSNRIVFLSGRKAEINARSLRLINVIDANILRLKKVKALKQLARSLRVDTGNTLAIATDASRRQFLTRASRALNEARKARKIKAVRNSLRKARRELLRVYDLGVG